MRFITLSLFATLLSAPAFAADPGTYRPGTPYSSAVAGGAAACDSQCAGDAQCRGWNYVKPNPRAAGICEFLSSVSAPIASPISISGESQSATQYSSRVTTGGTNTVRVGAQATGDMNTVRVGEAPSTRRIIRQAPTQRIKTQRTSTQPMQDMSLTAQQNRYRQGLANVPQPQIQVAPAQPQWQQSMPNQRPMFRPILDAPAPVQAQQFHQPQAQPVQMQASRRATGPRNMQGQGTATPQFNDPRMQTPQFQPQPQPQFQQQPQFQPQQMQSPQMQNPQMQQPVQQRGQSRPPIGQPIAAAPPQPTTPSQRLAQFTAQTRAQGPVAPQAGPAALSPEQARQSLFGQLNDDVSMPTSHSVPTQPVSEQPLGEILAGGY